MVLKDLQGIGYFRNSRMMNMKENYNIYLYKHNYLLTDGQKYDENNHGNVRIIRHSHTIHGHTSIDLTTRTHIHS
jgi:hypothetical protein